METCTQRNPSHRCTKRSIATWRETMIPFTVCILCVCAVSFSLSCIAWIFFPFKQIENRTLCLSPYKASFYGGHQSSSFFSDWQLSGVNVAATHNTPCERGQGEIQLVSPLATFIFLLCTFLSMFREICYATANGIKIKLWSARFSFCIMSSQLHWRAYKHCIRISIYTRITFLISFFCSLQSHDKRRTDQRRMKKMWMRREEKNARYFFISCLKIRSNGEF